MFSAKEIIAVAQGKILTGNVADRAKRVVIDSRLVKPGDLFIAIKGEKYDAHDFLKEVIRKGARIIIVDRQVRAFSGDVTIIKVHDTVSAMGKLARYHRQRFNIPVIAITGSAGKTTTKEMLAKVLKTRYKVLANPRSFNNHIGVPLTLFQLTQKHDIVILECGTNQPGDIAYLSDISRPQTVIITAIGESHLEKLKTVAGVLREKWALTKFVSGRGQVLVNADDILLRKKIGQAVVGVGQHHKASWHIKEVRLNNKGQISCRLKTKTLTLNTCGIHQVNNAGLAIAAGSLYGVPIQKAIKALKGFQWPEGRGRVKKVSGIMVIDDGYNANPLSLRAAIDVLAAVPLKGRKVLVVADMLELGRLAKSIHQRLGEYAAGKQLGMLLTIGDLARVLGESAINKSGIVQHHHFSNTDEAVKQINSYINPQDIILVKGSHAMRMQSIVQQLLTYKGKT